MPNVRQPSLSVRTARVQRDHALAIELADRGEPWAAVVGFYASYHAVKAAFVQDPIFSDQARCTAKHHLLTVRDSTPTSHHGRIRPNKVWGVNELVSLLYPQIGASYEQLHLASMQVRYGDGTTSLTLPTVMELAAEVIGAYDRGELRTA